MVRTLILGHSPAELQRLTAQAEFLRPITERLLREAGLRPDMRVLDLGCGAGDVSLLAAKLVGPEGHVVGVDRVASATEFATSRAGREGVRNVAFRQGTEASLDDEAPFDFAVGRMCWHTSRTRRTSSAPWRRGYGQAAPWRSMSSTRGAASLCHRSQSSTASPAR